MVANHLYEREGNHTLKMHLWDENILKSLLGRLFSGRNTRLNCLQI